MAKIVSSSSPILWSDGSLFQGSLILVFVPPGEGGDAYPEIYPHVTGQPRTLPRPLPFRLIIPIIDGILQDNFALTHLQMHPPGVRVRDFWVDSTGETIAARGALLTINADPFSITPLTLTAPTASTVLPSL